MNVPFTEVVVEDSALIDDRRQRVASLKVRRLSARTISAVLSAGGEPVTVETVEADLEWLRQAYTSRFGAAPTIDGSQEIGWAIADFEEMESVAWLEFNAMKQEAAQRKLSPMFVARARQGWLRTAAMMRVLRLKLLGEYGYLLPSVSVKSAPGSAIPKADDLRALLRQEGLLLEVTEAGDAKSALRLVAAVNDEEDDPVSVELEDPYAQWLDDGGGFLVE